MQLAKPVDIEYAIAEALDIHATPIPANLGTSLPYAVVTRTGGGRADLVVDNHFVDVDVYSYDGDWAGATDEAATLIAHACELGGTTSVGALICAVTVETMPYNNPDPDHPSLARSTFSLRVTARAEVSDT